MYVFDFLKRLFKKNNVGSIIYLCMNMVMYIALFGGFALPEVIPMAILLYLICLCIALSPIGEFILRIQCGCRKIKKDKYKNRLVPLFEEAYKRAKQLDPTISDHVKFFMSKSMAPNAFAVGRKTVCVTRGLCELEDEQILGILGHEFGHIANKDTDMLLVINVSNFLLTAVFFIVRIVISFIVILVGGDERPIGSILASFFIDLLLVWLMSLWIKLGNLFHMKSSRMNEYRADAFSCECGYAQNLYSALYVLEQKFGSGEEKSVFAALGSTHPETADRLDAIEEWQPGMYQVEEPMEPSKLGEQFMDMKNKMTMHGGEFIQSAKSKVNDAKDQYQTKRDIKVPSGVPSAGQMAPPPPPIPSGLQSMAGQMAPPPPPTMPAGMQSISPVQIGAQSFSPAVQTGAQPIPPTMLAGTPPVFQASTGRVTKSLSEIAAEKAKEEAERKEREQLELQAKEEEERKAQEEKEKTEAIRKGELCYARYFKDGLYYYGQVVEMEEQGATVMFFDGITQQLPVEKMVKAQYVFENMQCFGNWNNEGTYYPAHIIEIAEDTLKIQYDEDQNIVETVLYTQVRFALL